VLEGCGERGVGRAGGAGKVGAEGDGCEGHGTRLAELAGLAELAELARPPRFARVSELACASRTVASWHGPLPALERNQSNRVLLSFAQGPRSLMVAST
jgi:hypothetical protein